MGPGLDIRATILEQEQGNCAINELAVGTDGLDVVVETTPAISPPIRSHQFEGYCWSNTASASDSSSAAGLTLPVR